MAAGQHGNDPEPDAGPLIFLIAGEPSGDVLGGRLMAALRRRTGGRIRFAGVGGEAMAAEGLASLFSITDLAVFGLLEVGSAGSHGFSGGRMRRKGRTF